MVTINLGKQKLLIISIDLGRNYCLFIMDRTLGFSKT